MKRVVVCLMCLFVSGTAFGIDVAGTRGSANFVNYLGPYPDYATWSFEGGTAANPLVDNFGTQSISPYPGTVITSDGSVLHQTAPNEDLFGKDSGIYNGYFAGSPFKPTGTDGFTLEWRMKVATMGAYATGNGWHWGLNATSAESDWVRFKSGYYFNQNNGPDYMKDTILTYNGGSMNLPGRIDEWHTYRIAVLGEDAGTGIIKGKFYMDGNLIIESFNAGTVGGWGDSFLWMGNAWYADLWKITADIDYVRVDTTGGYAPVPEPATMTLLGCGLLAMLRRRK